VGSLSRTLRDDRDARVGDVSDGLLLDIGRHDGRCELRAVESLGERLSVDNLAARVGLVRGQTGIYIPRARDPGCFFSRSHHSRDADNGPRRPDAAFRFWI
jgi:hypothetical protein